MKQKIKQLGNKILHIFNKSNNIIKQNYQALKKPIKPLLKTFRTLIEKIITTLHLNKLFHLLKLDKFWNLIKENKQIFIKIFTLIFIPILIYLYCQLFCNGKIFFEHERMLLNFIFIYFIIVFFYCMLGKIKISLYLTTFLTVTIGVINYFITEFRGTPLVPWDIFSINVAMTVLPTFTFKFTKKFLLGILFFILAICTLKKVKFDSFKNGKLKVTYRICAIIIVILFTVSFFTTDLIQKFTLDENWDPKEEYHNNGLIASLFKQARNLIITKPEGYDIEAITKLASTIEVPLTKHDDDYEYPNIIAIMNESFADLSVIGNFSTNVDYMPYFRSLNKNTLKGKLHVSIFGATTPNSEWEFLTSNSMAFVPKRTVPYQQYVLRNTYSLATILKEQGYSTSAIHCYYPQGYNRNLAYPRLGFNKFYHINTLKDLEYIREYPSDLSTYKNIIDIYENKKKDEKIFNFTLTMQNHGSYTDENFQNSVIAQSGEFPKVNQYLSLIKIADEALQYLLEYFSNQEEHTIIVLFGDHQPYVEDDFYNILLSNKYVDITSKEATENKYITPFIIWANYDINLEKYKNITDLSANYLTSLLLDIAGIQKTPYLQFLDELRTQIPIITGNGYIDKKGIYYDFSEQTEYSELIQNYHYLQFNNMFDNSNKITSLFKVPMN